jgi:phospholipase C
MRTKNYCRAAAAALGGMAMASSTIALGADDQGSLETKIALLSKKVKYVFVIFHENESFDHYFGTYSGANGLFEAPGGLTPANKTRSFTQRYLDTSLKVKTISPFLMPQAVVGAGAGKVIPIYPADEISVDHSHAGMANGLDVNPTTGIAANDRYAMDQEGLTTNASDDIVTKKGAAPTSITLAQAQKAETDIGHLDCDTIPFMWSWAKNFVLFDNFRQTVVGPSTPNAIAIIAGQSGETQWALHPNEGAKVTYANPTFPNVLGASYSSKISSTNTTAFVPVVGDPGPFPGSNLDTNKVKPPYDTDENAANPTLDITFASLPLSFMGSDINTIIKSDENPAADLRDVQDDIHKIASFDSPVQWGWYQQGFNDHDAPDPFDGITPPALSGYVLHHNGPRYFGYLADNTAVLSTNLHGAKDFFNAVEGRKLPSAASSICAAAMTTTTGSFRWIRPRRSSTRSSATTITRPTRISRSPRPSRLGRSATSPTARTGRRAPSSSPTMRRTATIRSSSSSTSSKVSCRSPSCPTRRKAAISARSIWARTIWVRPTIRPTRSAISQRRSTSAG